VHNKKQRGNVKNVYNENEFKQELRITKQECAYDDWNEWNRNCTKLHFHNLSERTT